MTKFVRVGKVKSLIVSGAGLCCHCIDLGEVVQKLSQARVSNYQLTAPRFITTDLLLCLHNAFTWSQWLDYRGRQRKQEFQEIERSRHPGDHRATKAISSKILAPDFGSKVEYCCQTRLFAFAARGSILSGMTGAANYIRHRKMSLFTYCLQVVTSLSAKPKDQAETSVQKQSFRSLSLKQHHPALRICIRPSTPRSSTGVVPSSLSRPKTQTERQISRQCPQPGGSVNAACSA